jgi:hypothetical protein
MVVEVGAADSVLDSTSVWKSPLAPWTPTAVHADGPLHDAPFRSLAWATEALGLGTIDHTDPFHDSISVSQTSRGQPPPCPLPTVWKPTALQVAGPIHDTPFKTLLSGGEVLGLGTIDHTDPFHDSISV